MEMFVENVDVRKLARAYVALALAQDEAKRYALKQSTQAAMLPLLTSLDVTAELLEEILQTALPEKDSSASQTIVSSNLVM